RCGWYQATPTAATAVPNAVSSSALRRPSFGPRQLAAVVAAPARMSATAGKGRPHASPSGGTERATDHAVAQVVMRTGTAWAAPGVSAASRRFQRSRPAPARTEDARRPTFANA